jgi:hypothetical protein
MELEWDSPGLLLLEFSMGGFYGLLKVKANHKPAQIAVLWDFNGF